MDHPLPYNNQNEMVEMIVKHTQNELWAYSGADWDLDVPNAETSLSNKKDRYCSASKN